MLISLFSFSYFLSLDSLYLRVNSVPSLALSIFTKPHLVFSWISSSLWPNARSFYLESSEFSFLKSAADPFNVLDLSFTSYWLVIYLWGLCINEYPPRPLVGSAKPLISIFDDLSLYFKKDSVRNQLVSCNCYLITLEIAIF